MSLAAAQIFVRSTDADTVERVVAECLFEWAGGVGDLPVNEHGIPIPPPERRVVLLPPVDGWLAITEENGRVDRSIARRLAAETGALVLASELEGHFLSASIEATEPDGESDTWSVPDTGGDDGRMPIYSDAEAELFARLRARGVPSALIATDWEDMVEPQTPAATGARLHAIAGVEGLDKTLIPFGDIRTFDLLEGPRVKPDLWVADRNGAAQVVEARRVTGEWHALAIESLVRVEEAQLARILSTLAWTTDATSLPQVVFRYEGVDEVPFFAGLRVLRERRPRLANWARAEWLSIDGLIEALRRTATHVLPAFEIGLRCGRRVEVRHVDHPNTSFFVDLATLWRNYLEDPHALAFLLPATLESTLAAADAADEYAEEQIFPLLLGDGAPDLAQLAARPLTPGVWVAIGLDSQDAIRPLTREALKRAGVGFDDALELALHRLNVATEQNDSFVLYEQPEGLTLTAEFPDVASAARLLSPAVLAHVAQQLGDECFVAIPARDVFLAAEGTKEARRWLEREVARRFKANDLALTPLIWSVQNGELVEDARADLDADEHWAPEAEG